jgi:hypothetical protein
MLRQGCPRLRSIPTLQLTCTNLHQVCAFAHTVTIPSCLVHSLRPLAQALGLAELARATHSQPSSEMAARTDKVIATMLLRTQKSLSSETTPPDGGEETQTGALLTVLQNWTQLSTVTIQTGWGPACEFQGAFSDPC